MVTIVVNDPSVTEEQIQAFIKEKKIEGEYEVISKEKFEARLRAEAIPFILQPSPDDVPGMKDITAEMQARERKEKKFIKDQQKLARKFSNRIK